MQGEQHQSLKCIQRIKFNTFWLPDSHTYGFLSSFFHVLTKFLELLYFFYITQTFFVCSLFSNLGLAEGLVCLSLIKGFPLREKK